MTCSQNATRPRGDAVQQGLGTVGTSEAPHFPLMAVWRAGRTIVETLASMLLTQAESLPWQEDRELRSGIEGVPCQGVRSAGDAP
jgi:hypothetical protein